MVSPLRVATIGAGYFSQFHHDAWARMDDVTLVSTCDSDPAKAIAMAKRFAVPRTYSDPEQMLEAESPDILDIITPPDSHLGLIRLAADRGVNVICQKAFCRNLEEAKQAVEIAEAAGILLVVHENFRFQPWYAEVKARIESDDLGEVYQTTFRLRPGDGHGPHAYLDRQPYFQSMKKFLVHETAIHFVDTFRYLLGDYRSVYADLRRLNPVIAGEDAGLIVFQHTSGARSLFDGNRLVDHAAENVRLTMGELLVEGARAAIRLDGNGRLFRRTLGTATEGEVGYNWSRSGFGGDAVMRLQRHVVDGIRSGADIMNTGRDYLRCLEVENGIYRSAETERVQRL